VGAAGGASWVCCREFFIEEVEWWADGSFEFGEVIDAGAEKVVANTRREARGRASGVGVQFSYWAVTTFRNGRALRIEWFSHRDEALEAAGLSQ
jgi:ketosteroid isomerase-like protein